MVRSQVQNMKQRQFIYNGKGLRIDGNWDLAKILISKSEEEAKTVVLGICGLDGSLLTPLVPLRAEAWPDMEPVLRPVLQGIRESLLSAGYPLPETQPVFFCTDSYQKHRKKIKELHEDVWQSAALASTAPTPKAPATGRRLMQFPPESESTIVTGDPMHDLFKLRSLVSIFCNDRFDLLNDHEDLLRRLSMKPPSVGMRDGAAPEELSEEALDLLKLAVARPKSLFEAEAAPSARKPKRNSRTSWRMSPFASPTCGRQPSVRPPRGARCNDWQHVPGQCCATVTWRTATGPKGNFVRRPP